jgi:hypothetical protein
MTGTLPAPVHRRHQATVVYAVLGSVALVLLVQWVLLTAVIEGYLAGRQDLLVFSTLGSGVCAALAYRLIRHVR